MKFRRIDNETVRCVLTEEDMRENGIEMDDFFKDRDKVRGFLEQLVERAKVEVGYEAKHGMLSLQIVPLPHNAVSITFSEKEDGGFRDIFEHIKDIVSELGDNGVLDYIDGIEKLEDDDKMKMVEEFMDKYQNSAVHNKNEVSRIVKELSEQEQVKPKASENGNWKLGVYQYKDLDTIIESCKVFPDDMVCKSSLYKEERSGSYYVIIEKKKGSGGIEHLVNRLAEYSTRISDGQKKKAYLEEHALCMIGKNAIETLKGMN